jgi:hypothetical protein
MRTLQDGRGLIKVSPITAAIVNGQEDLSTWTDEELERGQKGDKNGRWPTKKPTIVARAVHDALTRHKMSKAHDLLRENTYKAVQVLVEVATDRAVDRAVRLKAAELILDRTMGKPMEKMRLDIASDSPFMQMIATAIVPRAQADVIEGEVIEEAVVLNDEEPFPCAKCGATVATGAECRPDGPERWICGACA